LCSAGTFGARSAYVPIFLGSLAATLLLAGCGTKPSTSSARLERSVSETDASRKLGNSMKLLTDSMKDPASPLHFSYKAQRNLNPRYPMDPNAKPEVGPVSLQADVAADSLHISETRGQKKEENKAKKPDQLAWSMGQLSLIGALADAGFALAFGTPVARPAGSDTVGGVATDKYVFDTSASLGSARAGLEIAQSMLGGKVKYGAVKGSAWLDKTTNRLLKFNIDTDMSDQAGNSWKEHYEGEATRK